MEFFDYSLSSIFVFVFQKICANKDGVRSMDLGKYKIASIFLPPEMYIRIIRKNERNIYGLRGPLMLSNPDLFESATSIDMFTASDFRDDSKWKFDDRDYYVVRAGKFL